MKTRVVVAVFIVFVSIAVVSADYLEVRQSVTLKTDPFGSSEILAHLAVGAQLELLQDSQENGYYKARDPQSGFEGWVYRNFVRRHPGAIPGTGPGPAPDSHHEGGAVWARFDHTFVERHFAGDLAFSSLTFDGQWRASLPHRMPQNKISCSGDDGEIHVGAYEGHVEFASNEQPFSRLDSEQTVAWGIVAEPPNATNDDSDVLEDLEGSRVTFTGYMRVWNEGHYDDQKKPNPNGWSNPNHLLELHPAWHMASDDEGSEDYDFTATAPMTRYAGYGMSKATSIFNAVTQGTWPRAYNTSGQLHLLMGEESNFHQLPVRIGSVEASNDGIILRADVCVAVGCSGNQFVYRNLRLITRSDSQELKPFKTGEITELLGIFSVHLGKARQLAGTASTEAGAVAVGDALEFYVFGRAKNKAVRTSKCVPE